MELQRNGRMCFCFIQFFSPSFLRQFQLCDIEFNVWQTPTSTVSTTCNVHCIILIHIMYTHTYKTLLDHHCWNTHAVFVCFASYISVLYPQINTTLRIEATLRIVLSPHVQLYSDQDRNCGWDLLVYFHN